LGWPSLEALAVVFAGGAFLVGILGIALQYFNFFTNRRERKADVQILKSREHIDSPFESDWTIRVRYINRTFEKCMITYDGKVVQTLDNRNVSRDALPLDAGGGWNFRIPKGVEIKNKAWVIAKDGDDVVKKRRWEELLEVPA